MLNENLISVADFILNNDCCF